jgi:hypothetical protein
MMIGKTSDRHAPLVLYELMIPCWYLSAALIECIEHNDTELFNHIIKYKVFWVPVTAT